MQFEVIKHGDMFLVTNRDGNIPNPRTDSFGYGLFLCDTRGVSRFEFETSIASLRLVHCDASTNVERRYRLINVDPIPSTDDREIPPHAIHVTRIQWVDGHQLQEECRIENFTDSPVELTLFYALEADFCDMFEVRGFHGPAARPAVVNVVDDSAEYTYITNDGWTYVTRARLVPGPHVKKHTLALLDEGHGTVRTVRFEAQVALPAKASANVRVQARWSWIDTYQGLTVPFLMSPFMIFLSRQFFLGIPKDLEEAARIDGLSEWGIFFRIALPLSRPLLAAQTIFTFQGNWNSFLWPVLLATSPDMYTLPVGLNSFYGQYNAYWNSVMAGVILLTLPIVLVFLIFQRQFVQGIATTGLKG